MLLEDARELAIQLMKQHGLEYWYFEFDNAKSRFGICRYSIRRIGLSRNLVLLNTKERVTNTILHEIAHALVGSGNGHNWIWTQKAIEIGCDGERCYSNEKVIPVVGRLIAKCPNCNHHYYKHRTPKRKLACGKCRELPFEQRILIFTRLV